jgi:ribosome maturation factor RimP
MTNEELLNEPRLMAETGQVAAIINAIEPSIKGLGFRLVRVRLSGKDGQTLQIMAERTDGTLNVSDCELISQSISPILDLDEVISGMYYLEVSSPGIDRPLVRASDFERFAGHDTKLETDILYDNRKRFRGVPLRIENNLLHFRITDVSPGQNPDVALPLSAIAEARLVMTEVLLREALRKAKAEEEAANAIEEPVIKGPGRFSKRNPVAWPQKNLKK